MNEGVKFPLQVYCVIVINFKIKTLKKLIFPDPGYRFI
jgi:hypothetical protein